MFGSSGLQVKRTRFLETALPIGKTVLLLPYGVFCAVGLSVKHFASLIIAAAWFRGKGVTCLSSFVSLRAKLEPKVHIGSGVVVREGVAVGAYTYINEGSHVDSGEIGKFCSIGPYVWIGPIHHPYREFSTHPIAYNGKPWGVPAREPVEQKRPPQIGNDVWIGKGAVVLSGVVVHDGAIIGANAVVTHDVPPYAIAAGVPARVLCYRFDSDTIASLERSRWWDRWQDPAKIVAEMTLATREHVSER